MGRKSKLAQVSLHADGFLRSFDAECREPSAWNGLAWIVGPDVLLAIDEDTRIYASTEYRRDPKARVAGEPEPIHRYELALVVWVARLAAGSTS